MIAAAALAPVRPEQARVEYVGGTHDGDRFVFDRVEDDGGPAKVQVVPEAHGPGTEVYVRRPTPSRCLVDGILVWHYDVDRNAVST